MIDESVIKKLEELEARTTPGKWWRVEDEVVTGTMGCGVMMARACRNIEAEFIVEIHNHAKALLKATRENLDLKETIKKYLSEVDNDVPDLALKLYYRNELRKALKVLA